MRKIKRALITGASGFIGTHLSALLHKKGFEVWGTYYKHEKNFSLPIRWIQIDLRRFDQILALIQACRPDYVFHLAGQAVPQNSWKDPEGTLQLNVGSVLFILEAICRFVPQARILLASSSHVYGSRCSQGKRVKEADYGSPVSPYGGSKRLMELAALNFVASHRLNAVIIRAFNLVGTKQNPGYAFTDFCRQVALMEKGKQPPVLHVGDIEVVRDFLHVRDGARGYALLAGKGKTGEIYNLGSGRGLRLSQAADYLRKISGVDFKVAPKDARFRKSDLPWIVSDSGKLRALGWRPRESVWLALREILDEWRQKVGKKA